MLCSDQREKAVAVEDCRELLLAAVLYGRLMCPLARRRQPQKSRTEPATPEEDFKDIQSYLKHILKQIGLGEDLCELAEPLTPHGPPLFTVVVTKCEEIVRRLHFAGDLGVHKPATDSVLSSPAALRREILSFAGGNTGEHAPDPAHRGPTADTSAAPECPPEDAGAHRADQRVVE
jgi:hypothetical protein